MSNAEVKVAIVGDNSSLQRSLAESRSSLGAWGAAVGKIALAAGVAAAAGIAVLGKASVDAAAQAQQSIGATQTVYGKYADSVIHDSRRAAIALGLSADEYRNNANTLGALLGNQGVAQDKLAGKTRSLITAGADLAATFGGDTATAVEALASAFKGEFDPLEQYGISIKQSTVNTEAMRVAGVKTTAAFNDLTLAQQTAAKQTATNNLIVKQSAKAHGQFARETETLAHQQQVLGAQVDDLKVKIGTALLPVVTDLFQRLNEDLMPELQQLAKDHLPDVRRALDELFSSDPQAKARELADGLRGIDWATLSSSASDLVGTLHELGPALADVSIDTVNDGLQIFASVAGFAADHVDLLRKALPYIVIAFTALKAAQLANNIAGRDSVVGLALQLVATNRLIAANRELAFTIREVNGAQAGSVGSIAAAGATASRTSRFMRELGTAAKFAGGTAGLALVAAGANTANDSLATLETTTGAAAIGFSAGGPWGAALGYTIGAVVSMRSANDDLVDSLAALDTAKATGNLDTYAAAIDHADAEQQKMSVGLGTLVRAGQGLDGFIEAAPKLWGKLTGATDDAGRSIDDARRELDGLRDGTLQLFNPVADLASGIGDVVQAALDEASAMQDATNAMRDKRREAVRGLDAELDYQAAIDDATASLRENGRTVDKTTEKGRANLRSLSDLAGAWNRQSDATKNARGAMAEARDGFVDVAQKMGLSEQAAKRLAARLLEIPPKRTVAIKLDGIDAANSKAQTLTQILAQLHSKDLTIALHYQTIGNKPPAPAPGATPRTAVPSSGEQRKQADKMRLYGVQLGDAFAKGAHEGAGHGPSLLDRLFGTGTSGLDAIKAGLASINDLIDSVVNKRIKDDKQAARRRKQIVADLREQSTALREIGQAQQRNDAALDGARASLKTMLDYANGVRDAFVNFGDLVQLGRLDSGKVSLGKLLTQLRKRAADAAEFQRLVAQLAAQGLGQAQIEQLTAAGPEAALATARAIAGGGQAAVDEIARLEAEIASAGGGLGKTLADKFDVASVGMGTDAAAAYVAQLEAQQDRLNKSAQKMASALVKQLQIELAAVQATKDAGKGGGKQGKQVSDEAVNGSSGGKQTVNVKLTSQQVSSLERGREIQLDLDTYRAAGGRSRA